MMDFIRTSETCHCIIQADECNRQINSI